VTKNVTTSGQLSSISDQFPIKGKITVRKVNLRQVCSSPTGRFKSWWPKKGSSLKVDRSFVCPLRVSRFFRIFNR